MSLCIEIRKFSNFLYMRVSLQKKINEKSSNKNLAQMRIYHNLVIRKVMSAHTKHDKSNHQQFHCLEFQYDSESKQTLYR